jgi:hypothetical protein
MITDDYRVTLHLEWMHRVFLLLLCIVGGHRMCSGTTWQSGSSGTVKGLSIFVTCSREFSVA